ncbi:hypothetical protein CH35J_007675 [Colletotrichum higginsianum]|uniref:Uncharacterized protein n=1 Tax=Colletotrichum higginsianum TaxID=80884 RepID=A0A4V4NBP9_9PEZI|nr:hypothetical protein CH35J_007675 [Colletotrichum higginsianum]
MDDQDIAAEIDPEMAAFMGFASFGTQPAAKKRKYNHRTDAVSDADTDAGHAPTRTSATGANQTALAARTPRAVSTENPAAPPPANTDEIALDDDDDVAVVDADRPSAAEDQDLEDGGARIYSDPSIAPALAHAQSLIDELSTRAGDGDAAAPSEESATPAPITLPSSSSAALPRRPDASWGKEMGSVPTTMPTRERPAQVQAADHQPRGGGGGGGHYQQHQGKDGKPWWEGYYDRASNENPWDRLEKKAGVQSRGSWVPRGQAQTA